MVGVYVEAVSAGYASVEVLFVALVGRSIEETKFLCSILSKSSLVYLILPKNIISIDEISIE